MYPAVGMLGTKVSLTNSHCQDFTISLGQLEGRKGGGRGLNGNHGTRMMIMELPMGPKVLSIWWAKVTA